MRALARYARSCARAHTYMTYPPVHVCAVVLAAFIFPEPVSSDTLRNIPPRRFLADASSLSFLAQNKFDFNKWVSEGVHYMPARVHEDKMQQVRA